ncbi:MAG: RNA polymerase subunit sigma [Chloroflexota bacterium]|nr:MAG: RNA polymerase subunit sigma [Chloroflexota bacterium]
MPTSSDEILEYINLAAELIRQAKHGVALTGAGISTSSGIPDFRSAGSGLWTRFLPMEVASLEAFRYHPQRFFEWLRPLASHMLNAQPNSAHKSLARLESEGYIKTVITQNIDTLHQRAGSSRVLEVHGTFGTLSCLGCYQQTEITQEILTAYVEKGIIPRCQNCGAILKPDVILFGEQLPAKTWKEARKAVGSCDLLFVIGSSLMVTPIADLPLKAMRKSASLIILNKTDTYLDGQADVVIHRDIAEILPKITQRVLYA